MTSSKGGDDHALNASARNRAELTELKQHLFLLCGQVGILLLVNSFHTFFSKRFLYLSLSLSLSLFLFWLDFMEIFVLIGWIDDDEDWRPFCASH